MAGRGCCRGAVNPFLIFDLGKIQLAAGGLLEDAGRLHRHGRDLNLPFQKAHRLPQVPRRDDLQAGDYGRLSAAFSGGTRTPSLCLPPGRARRWAALL